MVKIIISLDRSNDELIIRLKKPLFTQIIYRDIYSTELFLHLKKQTVIILRVNKTVLDVIFFDLVM